MDFQSLVATNLSRNSRPKGMSTAAEEHYYRAGGLPRLRVRALVSLASVAGVILLLTGIAQV